MLTKRQQVVLSKIRATYAYFGRLTKRWRFACDFTGSTSASTLYRLIDAELAALGVHACGDAVVETTERGDELVELLTTSLTKRQQEVLKSLLQVSGFGKSQYNGCWVNPCRSVFEVWVSPTTIYFLTNAELVGIGLDDGGDPIAALTPRGRRLAELLP